MYRERNFLTILGGVILGVFAINNLFTDAVNTAENLKHFTYWSKQSGLDTQPDFSRDVEKGIGSR
mgnify:CR=1 FL=1